MERDPFQAAPELRPILIAGATAVGKSGAAMIVAEALGGEIISVDSMQVYQGMDIGTAKPTAAERARMPHHLLDVAGLDEAFDAAVFVQQALEAMRGVQARGHVPVLCGGTGLYFQALLGGLGNSPEPDPALRTELEQTPLAALLDELARMDPPTWEKIDRNNPRRVIRAVEVLRLTGKPFSAQRADWESKGGEPVARHFFILARESADMHQRINLRVDEMFAAGLVAETAGLLGRGLGSNRTAMQAIGYRQVIEHLRGERDLAGTIELVKIRTRQYAKRQLTWFKRQRNCDWVRLAPEQSGGDAASLLLKRMSDPA